MKAKGLSLFVAAVLASNTIGLSAAYAQTAPKIDPALIDQSITAQSAEMKRTLQQVNALIKSMEAYKTAAGNEKQNAFVNVARLMITLLGLSSTAFHLKNVQAESSIELTLAAVSGILSSALERYVDTQRIDMGEIRSLIIDNQKNLSQISGVSKEDAELIAGAVTQLGDINKELESKLGDIQKSIDNGQTGVAIVAIVTLVLHYATPFLPAKYREVIANKAPATVQRLGQTKKLSMQGAGATNVATLLSTLAGMGSPDAQTQIDKILSNLYIARANLMKQAGTP